MYQYWDEYNYSPDAYKEAQIALNKRKINWCWVTAEDIKFITRFVHGLGICHGARNGFEVREFRKYGNRVIGTDISDTAKDYGLIQWDFHHQKKIWLGRFDFVYTNSLDHSHTPRWAVRRFMEQLKPGGKCVIHTGKYFANLQHGNPGDCFGATVAEMKEMLGPCEFYEFANKHIYIITR